MLPRMLRMCSGASLFAVNLLPSRTHGFPWPGTKDSFTFSSSTAAVCCSSGRPCPSAAGKVRVPLESQRSEVEIPQEYLHILQSHAWSTERDDGVGRGVGDHQHHHHHHQFSGHETHHVHLNGHWKEYTGAISLLLLLLLRFTVSTPAQVHNAGRESESLFITFPPRNN